MKKHKKFTTRWLAATVATVLLLSMMPMGAFAASSTNDSMSKVYVSDGVMGDGTVGDPTSFPVALNYVEDGGTIYIMGSAIEIVSNQDVARIQAASAAKKITLKRHQVAGQDPLLVKSLLIVNNYDETPFTISNMTFDGSGYSDGNWDMVRVDYGNVTFDNCVFQNWASDTSGAALAVSAFTKATLRDSQVINNKSGRIGTGGSGDCGGVSAGGTLNIEGNTVITGNKPSDKTDALDLYVRTGSTVNISGTAQIGTVSYTEVYNPFSPKLLTNTIFITSKLKNPITVRRNATTVGQFVAGDLIVKGTNTYALTADDLAKVSVKSTGHAALNATDNNIWSCIDNFVYFTGANGSFECTAVPAYNPGTLRPKPHFNSIVTIVPKANTGYRYKEGSFKVTRNNLDVSADVSLTKHPDKNEWTLKMWGVDLNVSAEFVVLPEQTFTDTVHEDLANAGEYRYILEVGSNPTKITMENTTDFTGGTAPDPLIAFALAANESKISLETKADGTYIKPLAVGETTITASAATTDSHIEKTQTIKVKVVKPLDVTLNATNYQADATAPNYGITFVPSHEVGAGGADDSSRKLIWRKVGETDPAKMTQIPQASWNWDTEYTLPFTGMQANTEYELVLTLASADNSKTVSTLLQFRSPAEDKITGAIEGTITGSGTVSIRVERGNEVIAGAKGLKNGDHFKFSNLPDGFYNLVATANGYTITRIVEVKDGKTSEIDVNIDTIGEKQTTVKVAPDAPPVAADQLNELFGEDIYTSNQPAIDAVDNGGTVEIRLTAEKTDETAPEAAAVKAKATAGGKAIGLITDLSVDMLITPPTGITQTQPITDTGTLVNIAIPLPDKAQGKLDYKIYRYHSDSTSPDKVDELKPIKPTDTPTEESFYIAGGYAHVFAQKFSSYAIVYSEPSSDDNGGDSGNYYTITASAGAGGKIEPAGSAMVSSGATKTYTIRPDAGYQIVDVLVNGKSVGAVGSYTFAKILANQTIQVTFSKLDPAKGLPYYVKNGQLVFIGFAAEQGGAMRYIAPQGETVLLKENPKYFTDIENSWAKSQIDFVTEREIFIGVGDSKFAPETGMTRAMFATIIGRLYERSYGPLATTGGATFTDVNYDSWYGPYLTWCAEKGIVKGIGGNLFAPEQQVTRQEMAAMLTRFAEVLNLSVQNDSSLQYTDASQIAQWAQSGARFCQENGIIEGRTGGVFAPTAFGSRAEVSAMVERFVKLVVKTKA